jgi:hypothetical protein
MQQTPLTKVVQCVKTKSIINGEVANQNQMTLIPFNWTQLHGTSDHMFPTIGRNCMDPS